MGTETAVQPGKCRECGCTEDNACPGGCYWVDEDCTLCSACANPAVRLFAGELLDEEAWAVVEVMGHRRFAGRISEERIGGATMLRVDVPACDDRPGFSKLLSGSAVFAITPVDEAFARAVAMQDRQTPLEVYTLPAEIRDRLLPAPAAAATEEEDDAERSWEP